MLLEREKGEDTGVGGKCVSITNGEMESHAEHHMQFHGWLRKFYKFTGYREAAILQKK